MSSVLSRELTGRRVVIANTQCFTSIFLWASGFVALEFLVDDWGALSLNAIRLGVSALFLMLWWILRDGLSVITHAPWSKGLIVGGLGWGIGSLLLFLGQRMSDPVTTTIVVAMMPLAGAAIEMIFEKRKLSWGEYLGIGLALSGGYLATGVSLAKSEVGVGVVLCFLAIFLFAWATRATTRQLGDLTATGQTTVTMIGGAVVSFGLYLGFLAAGSVEVQIGPVTPSVIWPLFIFLLPSSGIAQLLWIIGAGRLGIMIASFHMNAAPFYVMVILV
ncbi:MAG: DMT family transporter, partial [Proteobacteria bacterium]|nr:DMT family transporter [Pseudomonadota bacterium]